MTKNQLLDNRYQIINKLHETNLSITFQGKDTKNFNRLCLIKQLKSSYNPQLKKQLEQRFQQEAKILERLGNHPQIPDLYSYFSENNQFYLIQEWIAGGNLQEKLEKQGKLTESEVKDILIKILPVLEFLQKNQIIHRDIKPSNIMVNREKLPILIDFGIVKEIYTIVNQKTPYTVLGIGTPGFISPEQKKGQPTHASDIYSLGLTAIYLLSNQLPIDPFSWRKDLPNINSEFSNILSRAIEENLSDRYNTATEMLTELNKPQSLIPTRVLQNPAPAPSSKMQNSKLLIIQISLTFIAIIVTILSQATNIFINLNKSKELYEKIEIENIESIANKSLNLTIKKAKLAINKAKTSQKKAELEIARDELQIAIKELENIPENQSIENQIKTQKTEYLKIINQINQALKKRPCYELLFQIDSCQEYPIKLDLPLSP
ncbi:MAG: serine/threonine-protein kinase [Trichodesmium sp. St4_bin8_1]|nr:serine/threonine-protein kinase [Trichodesmium sp. St4_bin8_1]